MNQFWCIPIRIPGNAVLPNISKSLLIAAFFFFVFYSPISDVIMVAVQVMDSVSWAGSCNFQEKYLQRCQQGHRLLTDAIRNQFNEWCFKLQDEVLYNTNAALHKFVIRRHVERPDWIQPNLDRYQICHLGWMFTNFHKRFWNICLLSISFYWPWYSQWFFGHCSLSWTDSSEQFMDNFPAMFYCTWDFEFIGGICVKPWNFRETWNESMVIIN